MLFMEILKRFMKDNGLAMKDLAKACNIDPVTMWRIVNEKCGCTLDNAKKIFKGTGVNLLDNTITYRPLQKDE